ncbi:MAG TPA: sigma 54-interacting transcriptional regulator [Silvibacterium sp.]|nr:sigma 54-interacting transcriptional regulator [Silvibacterium sp.]
MKPRLMAISGSLRGNVRHLVDGQISIGRGDSNHVCVMDRAVSRKHCTIEQVDDRYELADLESHNGTFVNGIPVRRKAVAHGDTIRVGHIEFVFLVHEGDDGESTELHLTSSLSNDPSITELETIRLDQPAPLPHFGVEVGRMARDLAALFRISDFINSIRDRELLQRELLRLIFEVIPAENGAIALLANLDEEPGSVCYWSRQSGDHPPIRIQRDLVRRAIWEQSAVFTTKDSSDALNILCLPLVAVEKTLGVIYLTSSGNASSFGEDHIHFLSRVSRIAAVTLENLLALDALSSENQRLKEELHSAGRLVGESRQIGQVEEFIRRVAKGDSTVLIRGESGTGKELIARAIHHNSPRAARPFVAINCAAIPEALLESELFGHEKGAFTGAVAMKKGKLEAAEDGTVFLDEIGELAPLLQAKLLRVLQQREFERLGGSRCLAFTARVLAATNKNLELAIKSGEFRQDLYYRLNVVSVTMPPLRERRDDIPLLALYFAAKYAEKSKRPFKGISREARTLLMNYSWPGNVRELENAIEHAIVLGLTEEILPEDLPTAILEEQSAAIEGARYHSVLNHAKKELILAALREASGSYPDAARLLGIHPKYLYRLVRNLNLKSELR